MSRSIDLYSYNYEKLKNKVLEVCKTDNTDLVEKILLSCGNKIGDRYILLNQELWEDTSCYYNVSNVLEKIFKVDDVFSNVFCLWDDTILDKQDLISAIETYEIFEGLGLEYDDYED